MVGLRSKTHNTGVRKENSAVDGKSQVSMTAFAHMFNTVQTSTTR